MRFGSSSRFPQHKSSLKPKPTKTTQLFKTRTDMKKKSTQNKKTARNRDNKHRRFCRCDVGRGSSLCEKFRFVCRRKPYLSMRSSEADVHIALERPFSLSPSHRNDIKTRTGESVGKPNKATYYYCCCLSWHQRHTKVSPANKSIGQGVQTTTTSICKRSRYKE